MNKMLILICSVLILQCGLIACGVYQILSGNPALIEVGVFNILINLVFGLINIRNLLIWIETKDY